MVSTRCPTTILVIWTWMLGWREWKLVFGFQPTCPCVDVGLLRRGTSGALCRAGLMAFGDEQQSDATRLTTLPDHVVGALDLVPLLHIVARHCGTRRGHQALLSVVKEDEPTKTNGLLGKTGTERFSSRRMRAEGLYLPRLSRPNRIPTEAVKVSQSIEEARRQYALVEEAGLAMTKDNALNVIYPPFYGPGSHPGDTSQIEDTDNDEWLLLPADVWTLEHLLQAEKVLEILIATKMWASEEDTKTWMPGLAQIGAQIDTDDALSSVLDEVRDRVEIVRVRTVSTYSGNAVRTLHSRCRDNITI